MTFYIEINCVELKSPVAAYLGMLHIPNVLVTNRKPYMKNPMSNLTLAHRSRPNSIVSFKLLISGLEKHSKVIEYQYRKPYMKNPKVMPNLTLDPRSSKNLSVVAVLSGIDIKRY